MYFISAALAYLKGGALVLFDEPEIHLHPNAVALLMQTLQALLKQYDSYAIIATHSPVVIQEVPRKRVVRFEREDNITSAFSLGQESFGENISELTRLVFETVEIPNFYKQTLKDLAVDFSFNEVSTMFDDKLSLHATAYLASLYEDDNA
jgi:predicted ATPase